MPQELSLSLCMFIYNRYTLSSISAAMDATYYSIYLYLYIYLGAWRPCVVWILDGAAALERRNCRFACWRVTATALGTGLVSARISTLSGSWENVAVITYIGALLFLPNSAQNSVSQYIGCIDHTISENGIFREFGRPVLKWLLGYNYWELYRCSPHSILVGSFHQWWGYSGTTVTIVRVIHGTWRFSTDVGCVGLHSIATHVF